MERGCVDGCKGSLGWIVVVATLWSNMYLFQGQKELDHERRIRERSLIIELDDELASPDQDTGVKHDADDVEQIENDEGLTNDERYEKQILYVFSMFGLFCNFMFRRLKTKIVELNLQIETFASLPNDQREKLEVHGWYCFDY